MPMLALQRRRALRDATHELLHATTYEAWYAAAEQLDELSGMLAWRAEDEDPAYDAALIREDIRAFARLRETGDAFGLAQHIEESVYRHVGDLCLPALHQAAWTGTKYLSTRYLDAVCEAVDW